MQRLEFKDQPVLIPQEREQDTYKITLAFAEHGYEVGVVDAYKAWSKHSIQSNLTWAPFPDNTYALVRAAIPYLREA